MGKKSTICVNIGSSSIKIIQFKTIDMEIIIESVKKIDANTLSFINEDGLNYIFIEDILKMYLGEHSNVSYICFTLPDNIVSTKILTTQVALSEKSLHSHIKDKSLDEILDKDTLPKNSLNNKIFDCQILSVHKDEVSEDEDEDDDDEEKGTTEISISMVDKSVVKSLKKLCKELKLKPLILESEIISLLRFVNPFAIEGNNIFIDLGDSYTKIIGVYDGTSLDTHIINFGIKNIDSLYSKLTGCNEFKASLLRKEYGIETANPTLKGALKSYIDQYLLAEAAPIFSGIKDILDNSLSKELNAIYKVGGGWKVDGFKDYLYDKLSISCKNLAENVDESKFLFADDSVKEQLLDDIEIYSPCIGLLIRGGI